MHSKSLSLDALALGPVTSLSHSFLYPLGLSHHLHHLLRNILGFDSILRWDPMWFLITTNIYRNSSTYSLKLPSCKVLALVGLS